MSDDPDPREALAFFLYVATLVLMAVSVPLTVLSWRWAF